MRGSIPGIEESTAEIANALNRLAGRFYPATGGDLCGSLREIAEAMHKIAESIEGVVGVMASKKRRG